MSGMGSGRVAQEGDRLEFLSVLAKNMNGVERSSFTFLRFWKLGLIHKRIFLRPPFQDLFVALAFYTLFMALYACRFGLIALQPLLLAILTTYAEGSARPR